MADPAARAPAGAPGAPAWQTCLGPDRAPPPAYFGGLNEAIASGLRAPVRVLELGCAEARLGAYVRERFPGVHYTGIEVDERAAQVARTRIDRVIAKPLEDIDFAAEGILAGSIDTFIAGDVLEHLYDPWRALLRIRPLLTAEAQLAVCLPNVRNLSIHDQLHNAGSWRYDTHGLLDVTHIRFFALADIRRLLEETGFVVESVGCNLDPRFAALYQANRDKPLVTLQAGRLKIENLTQAEFQEYCTLQYIVRARPAGAAPSGAPGA
jgi:SAM-dependent methyltransferase